MNSKRRGSGAKRTSEKFEKFLCAKAWLGDSDTCLMQPGSGLYAWDQNTDKWYLGALQIWGSKRRCLYREQKKYGIFLKVHRYLDWIRKHSRTKVDRFGLHPI